MRSTGSRLWLALLALAAAMAIAQAQTPDLDHPGSAVAAPQAGMPMPDAAAQAGQPGAMCDDATAMKSMHDGMMKDGMPSTMPDRMAARHKMMAGPIGMM